MTFLEVIKGILFDVSPGDGYFGGFEGFIRMFLFAVIALVIGVPVYFFM